MKITFKNGDTALVKEGRSHLKSRAEAFKAFMKAEDLENPGEDLGSFYDYGLSVDYVARETFTDQTEGYLRYQLSYGGPSEEVRFYFSPGAHEPYRIEFVYLNWFSGVGFDVSGQEWAQWLANLFEEVGTVRTEMEKVMEE